MSITFSIEGEDAGSESAERLPVNEDMIAYFDKIDDLAGIDTEFFLFLDPYKVTKYEGEALRRLESYLAGLESQLADFFISGPPSELEPQPWTVGASAEETTPELEEDVLATIASLLKLCRKALQLNKPLLATGSNVGEAGELQD